MLDSMKMLHADSAGTSLSVAASGGGGGEAKERKAPPGHQQHNPTEFRLAPRHPVRSSTAGVSSSPKEAAALSMQPPPVACRGRKRRSGGSMMEENNNNHTQPSVHQCLTPASTSTTATPAASMPHPPTTLLHRRFPTAPRDSSAVSTPNPVEEKESNPCYSFPKPLQRKNMDQSIQETPTTASSGFLDGATLTLQSLALHSPTPHFTHLDDGSSPFSINTQFSTSTHNNNKTNSNHQQASFSAATAPALSWNLTQRKSFVVPQPELPAKTQTPKRAALKVLVSHTPSSSCERKRPPSFWNQQLQQQPQQQPQQTPSLHPLLALKSPRTRIDQSPAAAPRTTNNHASTRASPPRLFLNSLHNQDRMTATPPLQQLQPPSSSRHMDHNDEEEDHSFESTPLPNVTLNPRPATWSSQKSSGTANESIQSLLPTSTVLLNASAGLPLSTSSISSTNRVPPPSLASPLLELQKSAPPPSLMGPPSTIGSTVSSLSVSRARSDVPPMSFITTSSLSSAYSDKVPPVNISIMTDEGVSMEGEEPPIDSYNASPLLSPSHRAPLTQSDVSFIPLPHWKDDGESPSDRPSSTGKALSCTMSMDASSKRSAAKSAALSLFRPSAPNAPDPILDELMFGAQGADGGELLDDESLSTNDDPADVGFLLAAPREIQEERQQFQLERPTKHVCRRRDHPEKPFSTQPPNETMLQQEMQDFKENHEDLDQLPPLPTMTKRDSFSSNRDLITPPAMAQGKLSPPPLIVPQAQFH